jgi:hypothetical protein
MDGPSVLYSPFQGASTSRPWKETRLTTDPRDVRVNVANVLPRFAFFTCQDSGSTKSLIGRRTAPFPPADYADPPQKHRVPFDEAILSVAWAA